MKSEKQEKQVSKNTDVYFMTDNSGSFTGRGWRVSGPHGFDVYADRDEKMAREVCRQMNIAHRAALKEPEELIRDLESRLETLNSRESTRLKESARASGGAS